MLIYLQVIDAPEDRDQFITLYETYRGLMFYVANQILQNEQDAEDAVHDAFLSVAEHIKKFSRLERHKTKAFLVTIVENKAIDLYRKKTHRKEEILWEETTGLAPAYEPEDGLTRCILKLPARYREFLRLKHELGYSLPQCQVMNSKKTSTIQRKTSFMVSAYFVFDSFSCDTFNLGCKKAGDLFGSPT